MRSHRAKGGRSALANRYQLRYRPPVPLDHDFLAIFDEVEKLRQLRFRAVDANIHMKNFSSFFGLNLDHG